MTIAGAHLGTLGRLRAGAAPDSQRVARELAAIADAKDWLNSPRLTASHLSGKVVAVNFCTYTCINWLRTLPYVKAWAQKYRDRLILIGVHTPEFSFERNLDNVRRSVQRLKIEYPVVLDNDYAIWRAFSNMYWPALYFVDPQGRVREHFFGEGKYEQAEQTIQTRLAEAGAGAFTRDLVSVEDIGIDAPADWENLKSPENYIGYERTLNFASPGGAEPGERQLYKAPSRLGLNQWALTGEWTMGRESAALNSAGGRIVNRFHARDLHLVLGPSRSGASVRFRVTLDGNPPGPARGGDVKEDGTGVVTEQRLYQLIRQPRPIVDRLFEIEFLDPGAEAFAFTFG